MIKQNKWIILYFISFLIMILLNYLSGGNIGSVTEDNQAIIQPAGFAFSIWGLIYVLILAWIIKLFVSNSHKSIIVNELKYLPIINFLLNGLWVVVYTQKWIFASVLVIIALLYTISKIYTTLNKYKGFNRLPFSIYFGWVTVATIVNIFTLVLNNNIETILGLNELTWTIIILIIATLIGVFISIFFKDWLYPLVIIWPYFGIYVENKNIYSSLDITLILASLSLIIVSIIIGFQRKNYNR
ncbi:tryptophan-rich sensory protein [Staphylococcus gallinarum]|uniref:Tryptophan-rich sensory protein n=1 Tax=Staphylococcus gallinarum TaxID=1293 RepID=A0A418HL27_STAGA|nr:tryptophan-rich sensory protein [Staphylococcus gallinarum]RIL23411.1 tryptophan-rich sensory protein [Staphylococcus gallinarum]RIL28593.1 tryptophan-rich sensory protein [Staphylococcus gallinarum]RIL41144.1 tryptophan-rich sensory protein [Staphylococcus gallinarum]RIO91379.1 tryptophan-rich sensory protein [Staphylococcus gallinarum]